MKTIRPGSYPTDTYGWRFEEPLAGEIVGANFEDLVAKVSEFRASNKLPPGDPYAEVTEYLCTRNPSLCKRQRRPTAGPGNPPAASGDRFGDRVSEWASRFIAQRTPTRIPPEELHRRADACRACPLNVDFAGSCTGCLRTLRRAIKAFVSGYPRRVVDGLKACRHYECENALAVGADIGVDPGAPEGCWRRG